MFESSMRTQTNLIVIAIKRDPIIVTKDAFSNRESAKIEIINARIILFKFGCAQKLFLAHLIMIYEISLHS